MQTNLTWKKGFLSGLYHIYKNGEIFGKLKDKTFTQSAEGYLGNSSYQFKTKGFLKQHTEIESSGKMIGTITYNNWMNKATITLNSKVVSWKYNNVWNTKWELFDTEGNRIKYSGSSTSGEIETNTDDALLILSGLYVTNYYWQMIAVVMIAVFIPIWVTVLN